MNDLEPTLSEKWRTLVCLLKAIYDPEAHAMRLAHTVTNVCLKIVTFVTDRLVDGSLK